MSYDLKFVFHNALKLNNSSNQLTFTKYLKYTLYPLSFNPYNSPRREEFVLFNYTSKKIMVKKAWANFEGERAIKRQSYNLNPGLWIPKAYALNYQQHRCPFSFLFFFFLLSIFNCQNSIHQGPGRISYLPWKFTQFLWLKFLHNTISKSLFIHLLLYVCWYYLSFKLGGKLFT